MGRERVGEFGPEPRRVDANDVGRRHLVGAADSQGRSPYANVGQWFGTKEGDGWQTHTWRVTDACFAKMWGFDFSIRPEQSVPFVLGKVEVSTVPFKYPAVSLPPECNGMNRPCGLSSDTASGE